MGWQDRGYGPSMGSGGFRDGLARVLSWSFSLGRYAGVDVRVHGLSVVFAFLFFVGQSQGRLSMAILGLAVLYLSVLLHEFGHVFGCRSVGGHADQIMLWALGGLAYVEPPQRPSAHFVTVICGPLVNLILGLGALGGPLLLGWGVGWSGWLPYALSPMEASGVLGPVGLLLSQVLVINTALLLFNLLLVFYPFDGGRLVQVGLWLRMGYGRSMLLSCNVGMVGAVLVGLYGLAGGLLLLFWIALFGFLACYQQKQALRMMGDVGLDGRMLDLSAAYEQPGRGAGGAGRRGAAGGADGVGWIQRWRVGRARRRAERDRAEREKLDAEVDRILAKVKAEGIHRLTSRERRTLNRMTERERQG